MPSSNAENVEEFYKNEVFDALLADLSKVFDCFNHELLQKCVCVCVYTLSLASFFRLQDVCDILEMCGSTTLCCQYCWVLLPSSFICISKSIIFHLQRRNSSMPTNWREKDMIYWQPAKK